MVNVSISTLIKDSSLEQNIDNEHSYVLIWSKGRIGHGYIFPRHPVAIKGWSCSFVKSGTMVTQLIEIIGFIEVENWVYGFAESAIMSGHIRDKQ
jgi:hypothetical protein